MIKECLEIQGFRHQPSDNGVLIPRLCIRPSLQEEATLLQGIETTTSEREWLHYGALFYMVGIDASQATMAVPFLAQDKHYSVPGIRKIRFNNNYGWKDDSFQRLVEALPEFETYYADVTEGLPCDDSSVDFFVLNHGAMIGKLAEQIALRGKVNNYPTEVNRVTKPTALFMGYDYAAAGLHEAETAEYLAETFGLERIGFDMPESIIKGLCRRTGNITARKLEDFFADEHETPVAFFRKPLEITL